MARELNECIASRAFASLILDYEFSDAVYCRILIEDLCVDRITAKDRNEAIEIFRFWHR